MSQGGRDGLPIAWYLRPEEQVVAFRSRPELDELLAWCIGDGHAAARLVTGDGGAGKTRLALRLGQTLAANGWQQLWVRRGAERAGVAGVRTMGQPCLLVVDYAETRNDLAGLLDDMAADRGGPDMRVLLLARSAGEWWQTLLASAEKRATALVEAAPLELGPVPAAGGPQELFAEALAAFARRLKAECPEARLTLADPAPLVLVIHAAALLTVVDHALGTGQRHVSSAMGVLEDLLGHEARYWAKSAAARGLTVDLSVLRLAVALGCLIGADSQTSATVLLSRIPDLQDSAEQRGRVARWLHDLYPVTYADDAGGREWLGPLRPDRLAEQLITSELTSRPELIVGLFTGLAESRGLRALTVLARAALADDRAVGLLRSVLAVDLEHLAVPALSVAVETNPVLGELLSQVISVQDVPRQTLVRIADTSPYPSLALAAPTAAILQRLADDSSDGRERAGWLVDLSNRLSALGRREQALAVIEEAAGIYRQLAQARPDAFLPDLAMSLNNQSNRLSDLGRREEALAVIEEAVTIRRQLAQARPDAFLPDLAGSLNNQSTFLSALGRREQALAAIEEAAGIYRQLAQARPDAFLPDLATALNNQSAFLSALGRREQALAAIEEAAGIYRQLAQARPDAFLPDLATALNNQSAFLSALGRREEALAAIEEAAGIYRQLAQARPDAFLPDLAMSLNNQSNRLSDLGRREEALAAIEEAVTIYRQLAQARPDAFLPDLAGSLNNQSNSLSDLGRREQALAAIEEAAGIYRQLAQARPDAFLPDLATALNNQSIRLSDLGRREQALAAIEEAVTIRRQLAQARPDAFLPDLAGSLNNQSACLSDLGRREEALAAIEEAAGIYRQLAQARPDAFLPDLAMSLNNQSACLSDLGRREEALAVIEEAAGIYRQLAQARPDAFLPDLARALNNQSIRLSDLGRRQEALAAIEEAVTIRRQLAQARPDAFLPDLARALNILANTLSHLNRDEEASAIRDEANAALGYQVKRAEDD